MNNQTGVTVVGQLQLTDEISINIYGSLEEPIFMGKDIAVILGHNPNKIGIFLNKINDEDKLKVLVMVQGALRERHAVTEAGLYDCFMLSRLESAKAMKREMIRVLRENRLTKMS